MNSNVSNFTAGNGKATAGVQRTRDNAWVADTMEPKANNINLTEKFPSNVEMAKLFPARAKVQNFPQIGHRRITVKPKLDTDVATKPSTTCHKSGQSFFDHNC